MELYFSSLRRDTCPRGQITILVTRIRAAQTDDIGTTNHASDVTRDVICIVAGQASHCSNILISATSGGGSGLSESILVFKIGAIATKLQV